MNDRAQRRLIVTLLGAGIAFVALGIWFLNRDRDPTPVDTGTTSSSGASSGTSASVVTTTQPAVSTTSTTPSPTTLGSTSTSDTPATFALLQVSAGAVGAGDVATDSFTVLPEPGSLLLAFLSYHSNEQVLPPTGWDFNGHGDGSGVDVMVYSRIATGEESEVTFTLGTRTRWIVQLLEVETDAEAVASGGSTSGSAEVTSLDTGSVPVPPGAALAVAAVTYDFDVASSPWSDGFTSVASLGGGAANNQMHLEVATAPVADSAEVGTSTSWSAAARASSILIIYG